MSQKAWSTFPLAQARTDALAALGWTEPTDVQARGLRQGLTGRDLLVCAPTGTGKTGLYALSALERVERHGRARHAMPRALVLLPTRELAEQSAAVIASLGARTKPALLLGGVPILPQDRQLEARPDIVVATPGRLQEHLRRRSLMLDEVEVLVLDEADRLFDASFIEEVKDICQKVPEERQTILLSATLPPAMDVLARSILRNPVRITVGVIAPRENIREAFYPVGEDRKLALLQHLLEENHAPQTLIFTRTRKKAEKVLAELKRRDPEARALHAGITQQERLAALAGFREGTVRLLVATDLASRGIDIPELALVVNFDVPNTPEDYIHRSGRTGRLNRAGAALTLVTHRDLRLAGKIESMVRRPIAQVRLPEFLPRGEEPAEEPPPDGSLLRELERPRDMDERRTHRGKAKSPFTRSGRLTPEHQPEIDRDQARQRNARKRLLRKLQNRRLPHQRRRRN